MVSAIMNAAQNIPRATYRLQLNKDFTFVQATAIVPYLAALGISHCYISPILKARPGSMHGYDIVDHNSLNPEIGTPEEFDRFVNTLHQQGMGLIVDIVPNHMGIMGSDNAWWLDVLENGEASAYSCFFDIDWHPLKEELHGKVLVPVLHDHYGAVLESGELKLAFRADRGEFDVVYRDHRFPVDPREYPRILQTCADSPAAQLGEQNPDLLEFQSLITAFSHLPARNESASERIAERNRDKEIHKRRLAALCERSPEIAACVNAAVDSINGTPQNSASFEQLHELIKAQTFRLANWRVASDDINYRRFFDTNDLAAICMENEAVFRATHHLILDFIAQGKIDGLRIDHPDGLYDPAQYFQRLRQAIAEATSADGKDGRYVVIEKILTGAERLPSDWAVSGTTGYDFSNLLNGLFIDRSAAARFERIYRNFTGNVTTFDDIAYRCRKLIIRVALASELNVLAHQLSRIALAKRTTCDFTLNSLGDALTEVVANFPVYRTYISPCGISDSDTEYIRRAVALAKWRSPAADTSIFDFVREVVLTRIAEGQDVAYRKAVGGFAMKFQQFTSPVMAKGLEDTAFYRYNRLVSVNDVGGDLRRFGTTPNEFHLANQERLRDWPHTMLATSTHDSKRSEDVRTRIDVLSELSGLWRLRVRDWRRLNRTHRKMVNDKPAPSANDEYLLYQTLIGAWPSEPLKSEDDVKNFSQRIQNYMLKSMREAKQNTSWINRNEDYENAVSAFIKAVTTPGDQNKFLKDFAPFQQRVARIGLWNSLSQTLLKLTAPGVPDIYQGNDLWDFSLVDPDNRRPVDYDLRREMFASISNCSGPEKACVASLLENPEDSRLKLYVTWKTLCLRKDHPDLFRRGEYVPLTVQGDKANHVIAFLRKFQGTQALVVAPRLIAGLLNDQTTPPIGPAVWGDTRIVLPKDVAAGSYTNLLTGEGLSFPNRDAAPLAVSQILADFPVGLYLQA
jgi:(1->4)-alpha-D-glucan 1-alpha-D-glucosylmutase